VSQERERQIFLLSDSTDTPSRVIFGFTDGVDTQVRQLGALECAFRRIRTPVPEFPYTPR